MTIFNNHKSHSSLAPFRIFGFILTLLTLSDFFEHFSKGEEGLFVKTIFVFCLLKNNNNSKFYIIYVCGLLPSGSKEGLDAEGALGVSEVREMTPKKGRRSFTLFINLFLKDIFV